MGRALREALRISEAGGQVDPRLLNNLGALYHLEGNLGEARGMYESALTSAAGLGPEVGEGMSTSMLYNLARVYEDTGDEVMAKEAYDKLLSRHPEYVDGMLLCGVRSVLY
jgi:RNA polymerase-associated protein CTR9